MVDTLNRCAESSTKTGTGATVVLGGALTGRSTFAAAAALQGLSVGASIYAVVETENSTIWEGGVYTLGVGEIVRTAILATSAGNTNPVDFPAGVKRVVASRGAEKDSEEIPFSRLPSVTGPAIVGRVAGPGAPGALTTAEADAVLGVSLTPGAGLTPRALASGKIADGWATQVSLNRPASLVATGNNSFGLPGLGLADTPLAFSVGAANRLWLGYISPPQDCTIERAAHHCSTATAGTAELVIYDSVDDGNQETVGGGALVASLGSVTTNSTAVQVVTGLSQILRKGKGYLVGALYSASPPVHVVRWRAIGRTMTRGDNNARALTRMLADDVTGPAPSVCPALSASIAENVIYSYIPICFDWRWL